MMTTLNEEEQANSCMALLMLQNTGNAAIELEKKHYRQLAKKLKLKKGRKSAVDDGLDDLLAGITTANMGSDDDLGAGVCLRVGSF